MPATTNQDQSQPKTPQTPPTFPSPPKIEDPPPMKIEAEERDARISGYTDDEGQAVSMAKKDVRGNPTGAYTDVGAGRSSVVETESSPDAVTKGRKTVEDAPAPGAEQAP